MKELITVVLIVVIAVLLPWPVCAQSDRGHATMMSERHGTAGIPMTFHESFPMLAGPGEKISLGSDRYFVYGFDKKPKLGTTIMKVSVFSKTGAQDTSLKIMADYGMPSMKGAHETGGQSFSLSRRGEYLLPVNVVMPGQWEIRFTFMKGGRVLLRGAYRFDV
ncbi:MAG: hypothetical protein PHY31_01275 [Smithellaceae bacterium]|nr:hypothetical protein [Smithellaceae bacterium]